MAGEQEVRLKLTADTAEAVKSVKELEKAVHGIDKIRNKGERENGFLSNEDVKQFRQLSRETEMVYKDFLTRFDTLKRDMERKKRELEKALSSETDNTAQRNIQEQIRQLETQRALLQSQMNAAQSIYGSGAQSISQVEDMRTDNAFTMIGRGMGGKLFGTLTGIFAFGAILNQVRQGMSMVKSEEEFMAMLGNRIGGYAGDYQRGREDALATGKLNNYSAMETMQLADQFSSIAGGRNIWNNISAVQSAARAMGVDPAILAQSGATLQRLGALDDGEQRKFAELLAGSIVKQGMAGRDRELIESVNSMVESTVQGRVRLAESDLQQLVGLQALLGSREEGWTGQRGANIVSTIDQSIKAGGSEIDYLLGWGTELQGISGRAELERRKARGVTDPENLRRIFSNLDSLNYNDDYKALILSQIMPGLSFLEAERLLQSDIKDSLISGRLSKSEIDAILTEGGATLSRKGEEYAGSEAARRSRFEVEMEEFKKSGGELVDSIFYPIASLFGSLPEPIQWMLGIGASGGAALLGGKFIDKLMNRFGTKIGKGGGGKGGFFNLFKGFDFKDAGKGLGKFGKAGGKFLGPLGFLATLEMLDDPVAEFADWLFGHTEGAPKPKGILDAPWKDAGVWEDSRQGAISKFWDFITKSEKEKRELKEIEERKEKNAELERKNLEARETLLASETILRSEEERMLSSSSSGVRNMSLAGASGSLPLRLARMFGFMGMGIPGLMAGAVATSAFGGGGSGVNSSILGGTRGLTAKQINDFIASKAPKNSVLRGQGEAFLRASRETGLDVGYLIAHAAHETGWGTSKIAREKGNMYGIGAFDSSPYASAYSYDNVAAGIIEGAKWIKKNYADRGQDTLKKMRHNGGVHEYATDPLWDEKIARIMKDFNSTLNVKVSGSIDGLTRENNALVAGAIASAFSGAPNLAYAYSLGVGGNR